MTTDNGNENDADERSSRRERPNASDRWKAQNNDSDAEDELRSEADSHVDSSEPLSRDEWEALASDPDATDFGYRATEWNSFETPDNSEQVMFLPDDESLLEEDAFVVAEESDLCVLGEHC